MNEAMDVSSVPTAPTRPGTVVRLGYSGGRSKVAELHPDGSWGAVGSQHVWEWARLVDDTTRVEVLYEPPPSDGAVARLWPRTASAVLAALPEGAAIFRDGAWLVTGEEECFSDEVLRRDYRVEIVAEVES